MYTSEVLGGGIAATMRELLRYITNETSAVAVGIERSSTGNASEFSQNGAPRRNKNHSGSPHPGVEQACSDDGFCLIMGARGLQVVGLATATSRLCKEKEKEATVLRDERDAEVAQLREEAERGGREIARLREKNKQLQEESARLREK